MEGESGGYLIRLARLSTWLSARLSGLLCGVCEAHAVSRDMSRDNIGLKQTVFYFLFFRIITPRSARRYSLLIIDEIIDVSVLGHVRDVT